jgi:predicted metal-dependent phosphotriesterase family hydrolase
VTTVKTVRGPVALDALDALGPTLMHEHVFIIGERSEGPAVEPEAAPNADGPMARPVGKFRADDRAPRAGRWP